MYEYIHAIYRRRDKIQNAHNNGWKLGNAGGGGGGSLKLELSIWDRLFNGPGSTDLFW